MFVFATQGTANVRPAIEAGTQTASSGTVIFSNSNNVSFGMSNSSVVTATVAGIAGIAGSGAVTASSGTVVFSNSNGATFGLNGQTMTASFVAGGAQVAAGTQTASSGTAIFSNSNGISFGMSGSATITASYASLQRSYSFPDSYASTNFSVSNAVLSLLPFTLPAYLSATQMLIPGYMTGVTNSSGGLNVSFGLYTMSQSTASLASSTSSAITWGSTNYSNFTGMQYRTLTFATMNLTPGNYLLGLWASSLTSASWSYAGASGYGPFVSQTTAAVFGIQSASFATGMPASYNLTDVTNYNRTVALLMPAFLLQGSN